MFTATHSITSTCFGCITIVLKFPLTSAASTNGLHRYNGFEGKGVVGLGGGSESVEGKVAEVGVVDRFGGLGALCIDRPMELKNDIVI